MNFARRGAGVGVVRGFTLVEMLVVIAIIGVLASMCLPALQKALNDARGISCVNNLKMIGSGVQAYAGDYNEWAPVSNWAGIACRWRAEVFPYVAGGSAGISSVADLTADHLRPLTQGAFFCPAKDNVVAGTIETTGYGWNRGENTITKMGFGYREASDTSVTAGTGNYRRRLSEATIPSESLLCGDTTDWWLDGAWTMSYLLAPTMTYVAIPTTGNRHNDGVNVAWADGHAGWAGQTTLMAGKNGNQSWYFMRLRR